MEGMNDHRTKTIEVTISRRQRVFNFRLYTRPINLGSHVKIQYYWMDSSMFRHLKSPSAQHTFQNVVGHWLETMELEGCRQELDQQIHHISAVCYALVASSKSMQDVYKDAYLGERRTKPTMMSLPDEVRKRVRRVVRKRENVLVREEFDRALGRFDPSGPFLPLLQEAFRRWVGNGVVALRRHGNDGLEGFLGEVDSWIERYRKKGGLPLVRQFVNLFSYECKVSFYRCYANTWIDLIPRLREAHGLDEVSERFLRFWHNQNQPNKETGERPVFNGQVLALHPLSAFFMKDPSHLEIAGRFFGTRAYDRVMKDGDVRTCKPYWEFIGALLSSAYLYRAALDAQPANRGLKKKVAIDAQPDTRSRKKLSTRAETSSSDRDEFSVLREFVEAIRLECNKCRKQLALAAEPAEKQTKLKLHVDLICQSCRNRSRLPLSLNQLENWLDSRLKLCDDKP